MLEGRSNVTPKLSMVDLSCLQEEGYNHVGGMITPLTTLYQVEPTTQDKPAVLDTLSMQVHELHKGSVHSLV